MDQKLIIELITVPLFTGIIGYITNWSGVLMLFAPLNFHGIRLPGLKFIYSVLPRRVQVIPAIQSDGRFGWQGIVPSRAEKMASIAVDKSLAKLGSVSDFYQKLEPDLIADQLAIIARGEIRGVVTRIMEREDPQLWYNLPNSMRDIMFHRIENQLPEIVKSLTTEIGRNIDQLVDAKLMVIRYLSTHPKLLNDIFRNMGHKELRFMQNFGFYFGYPMGFVLVALIHVVPQWWVLPVGGVVIGYVVNYLGITMIFEPIYPKQWVPWKQGLFIKRKAEISEEYARTISENVITLRNLGEEMLYGPRSDRTRQMLSTAIAPALDQALGSARRAVRVAVGRQEYDRISELVACDVTNIAPLAFSDPEFNKERSGAISDFVSEQMSKLSLDDFNELLRSAVKQDEWLLFVHGAVLGFVGGLIHLAIFGV
ncbi:MAG: DUF445 domain-containing protein [Mycobacteriaceae bacterium]